MIIRTNDETILVNPQAWVAKFLIFSALNPDERIEVYFGGRIFFTCIYRQLPMAAICDDRDEANRE